MTQKILLCSGSKNILLLFTGNTLKSLELEELEINIHTFFFPFFLLILGNGYLQNKNHVLIIWIEGVHHSETQHFCVINCIPKQIKIEISSQVRALQCE